MRPQAVALVAGVIDRVILQEDMAVIRHIVPMRDCQNFCVRAMG